MITLKNYLILVLLKKLQRTLPTGYKVCVDEALTKSGKKSV
ncbi:hypothetical protein NSP_15690 [Nodularia spumigena CCY9414]|nr:hypothetical protein NSP_15690 [Nodularia spumigena CCY9414]